MKAEATVDLYSTRSRKQEAQSMASTLALEAAEIEGWFFSILNEFEAHKVGEDEAKAVFGKVDVPPMTSQQRLIALDFLRRPDLVAAILADMEALGYMGEEEAKLLVYCVSVSRKLDKPLSAIIQSGSGAGKSYLADTVYSMTPPEDVVFYSRISPQVLYHMPKEYLMHKLVGLEERVGGESSDYPIRALQSSGILKQCITIKDPVTGQLLPKESEVWGPIAFMETTTSQHLNPENTSRCFEIPLDESPEQTMRIHQRQKDLKGFERLSAGETRQGILQRHHDAQRLLEPVPVIIPFVHLLTFPALWLRARRDHDRFLHLIEVLAYLHQFQRPRQTHQGQEYINATAPITAGPTFWRTGCCAVDGRAVALGPPAGAVFRGGQAARGPHPARDSPDFAMARPTHPRGAGRVGGDGVSGGGSWSQQPLHLPPVGLAGAPAP